MDLFSASNAAIVAWGHPGTSSRHSAAAVVPIQISSLCSLYLLGWHHRDQHLLLDCTTTVPGFVQAPAFVSSCASACMRPHYGGSLSGCPLDCNACSLLPVDRNCLSKLLVGCSSPHMTSFDLAFLWMQRLLADICAPEARVVPIHACEILGGPGGLPSVRALASGSVPISALLLQLRCAISTLKDGLPALIAYQTCLPCMSWVP